MRTFFVVAISLCLMVHVPFPAKADTASVPRAAFVRSGNLWIKANDREEQVTKQGNISHPLWSYDGRWLAYLKNDEIWVYDTKKRQHDQVYHTGGSNYQWAPDKNILAFSDQGVLNVSDFRQNTPQGFVNIALGVDNYSWLPNGSGFLVSSHANLQPDGWTNPQLFTIRLGNDLKMNDLTANVRHFFTIPKTLKKGTTEIISIGTSTFKWSPDQKWIAFIVHPTASWSMDSDMLCVLSANGKKFVPLDEMLNDQEWFQWSLQQNRLGYIQGGGRIIFGFTNKQLKVEELPSFQSRSLTPNAFVDLGFTWMSDSRITVARSPERAWSIVPAKRALPALYRVELHPDLQQRITAPPNGYGDFSPIYIRRADTLAWVRSNYSQHDVWIAAPDGRGAKPWIQQIDAVDAISWYNPDAS